jgi:membrane-anchored glycerophosphoryl diester phosphodiesterase (GDPDase)
VTVGGVIGEAWALYKGHFRHLVTIGFLTVVIVAAISIGLVFLLGNLGVIAAIFVAIAGVFWLQGALVVAVDDVRDGRADLTIRETFAQVRKRMNTLSMMGIFFVVMFFIAGFVIGLGFYLFIIPGFVLIGVFFYFLVRWILAVPVIMLEQRGVFGALDRSGELVRGHGWPVLWVILLTLAILAGAGILLTIALTPLPDGVQRVVANVVSWSVFAPFAAIAWTVMYFALRPSVEATPAEAPAVPSS